MPASILASTIRIRRGSSENVVIAVRWLHSLVTSMIPSTGRKIEEPNAAPATRSPYWRCSSLTPKTIAMITSATSVTPNVTPISHRPARVSADLRSSTVNSLENGMPGVPATSSLADVGAAPAPVLT
jgi:hypothetical protein